MIGRIRHPREELSPVAQISVDFGFEASSCAYHHRRSFSQTSLRKVNFDAAAIPQPMIHTLPMHCSLQPLGVTKACTTPSADRLLWSSPIEMAKPFRPLKKSLAPAMVSTTQQHPCRVRTWPFTLPHQPQARNPRSSSPSRVSISISALSPEPLRPAGLTHSAARSVLVRSKPALKFARELERTKLLYSPFRNLYGICTVAA